MQPSLVTHGHLKTSIHLRVCRALSLDMILKVKVPIGRRVDGMELIENHVCNPHCLHDYSQLEIAFTCCCNAIGKSQTRSSHNSFWAWKKHTLLRIFNFVQSFTDIKLCLMYIKCIIEQHLPGKRNMQILKAQITKRSFILLTHYCKTLRLFRTTLPYQSD